jgi:sugar phosphate isomerase/epimerase
LLQLGDYAEGKNVTVLMESHGDVVWIEDILAVMTAAAHKQVGLLWDVSNMWSVTKESPKEAYSKLKSYIRHTHIKDAHVADGKLTYTLLGKGDVPIFEAIEALEKDTYKGFYSFEWEKLWHPEIEEPSIALAHYPGAIKRHLKR